MGMRYVVFRVWHMLQVTTGVFKRKFPIHPPSKKFIKFDEWKMNAPKFLISSRESIELAKQPQSNLESSFQQILSNTIPFFSNQRIPLQKETQWHVNPDTGYVYDKNKHWSLIDDLSEEAGDIKFVWEKARFSYLHDVFRYDYHFEQDNSAFVFSEIEHFIDHNPINQGPQYKCSQEISLRILNWTYALYFYKNSTELTASLFDKIMNAIYWQLHHVYHNIHFSRIAVRNNHAITETLVLYLSGLLFPFMPETAKWSKKGKNWFEQEVAYQIYDDGTFLQYSINYHRVVVQLLTWAIRLNDIHGDHLVVADGSFRNFESCFRKCVYEKASLSLDFLETCMDESTGWLPNYGSNDGALFFKWTDDHYRDYKSQLSDLRSALLGEAYWQSESMHWYGLKKVTYKTFVQKEKGVYEAGGYCVVNEVVSKIKTFLHCGSYKDRPAQADNNHLDIWVDGVNYLWDNGSYKYNTSKENINHFTGTKGHNTVTINNESQMLKGSRFIWFYWIKKASLKIDMVDESHFNIMGTFEGFRQLGGIEHIRHIRKEKNKLVWIVEDVISTAKENMQQHWHINPEIKDKIEFRALNELNQEISPTLKKSKHSLLYGSYTDSDQICFETQGKKITTTITIQS